MFALVFENRVTQTFTAEPPAMPQPFEIIDVSAVSGIAENWTRQTDGTWAAPVYPDPGTPAPVYIPASVIRTRLQDAGLWSAAVAVLMAHPEDMLWFTTLELGVPPGDETAVGLLTAIGADPAVILAPPV